MQMDLGSSLKAAGSQYTPGPAITAQVQKGEGKWTLILTRELQAFIPSSLTSVLWALSYYFWRRRQTEVAG